MKRRSGIFIKMFAWFWAVTTVVIAITILIDRYTDMDPRERHMHSYLEALVKSIGPLAIAEMEKGNQKTAAETLSLLQTVGGVSVVLFSAEGNVLLPGSIPNNRISRLAWGAKEKGAPLFFNDHQTVWIALPYLSKGGKTYVLTGQVPWERFHPSSREKRYLLSRLAIALVVSCLACFLLARYLTIPIIRLREAARRLAAGDLTVRIPPPQSRRWDEIGELADDFDQMSRRIAALLTSQQQLLANISHELRSPLARLNVALELARQVSPPEAEKALRRIEWEAEKLNELIGRLLTFSRLETSIEALKTEPLDLLTLLQEIVEDADFEARGRNREVHCEVQGGGDFLLVGDKALLASAIENVIRNALFYTPEETTVRVVLDRRQKEGRFWAEIQVRDQGPGVPEEALDRLFEPFFRVSRRAQGSSTGSGLGLAIAERAVHLHQGTVKAWNSPEGGLVVEIILPLQPARPV